MAEGIAALIILSARYSLAFGKDEFSSPNWSITQKFDLFELGYKFLPSSYDQMRTVTLNYETLTNIYYARRNHKLDEWHTFCDMICALPYAKALICCHDDGEK